MIEKQLTDSEQIVHFEHLGAQLSIETLHLLNMASLQAQEGSQYGSRARTTHIVKHLVSSKVADFFQMLQNYNRYQPSVCVCVGGRDREGEERMEDRGGGRKRRRGEEEREGEMEKQREEEESKGKRGRVETEGVFYHHTHLVPPPSTDSILIPLPEHGGVYPRRVRASLAWCSTSN